MRRYETYLKGVIILHRVMLSDFKKAIDKYLDEYGDAEVGTVARYSGHKEREYTIVLGENNIEKGIHINYKKVVKQ